jgi:hypothetical protein
VLLERARAILEPDPKVPGGGEAGDGFWPAHPERAGSAGEGDQFRTMEVRCVLPEPLARLMIALAVFPPVEAAYAAEVA